MAISPVARFQVAAGRRPYMRDQIGSNVWGLVPTPLISHYAAKFHHGSPTEECEGGTDVTYATPYNMYIRETKRISYTHVPMRVA